MRNILRKALAVVAGCALSTSAWASHPDYVFLFIGDGMGPGQVMTAQNYLRAVTQRPDTTLLMTSLPVTSLCTTYRASSPVTDSAAAGTAIATGTKTRNNMLGMASDTTALRSIARDFQQLGYGIGLVTNVAADDATPAAFYANVPDRGMYYEIGRQAAESGYEFIAGAGLRGFSKQGQPTGLASHFDRYNVKIVHGLDELAQTDANKVVLLSPDTIHNYRINYAIEARQGDMSLPSMTRAAIDHMMRVRPQQFFMMVEGGAIDHAGHANDGASVIGDVLDFDRALREAYNFYLAYPEQTLIVVTADHETGGMSLGNNATGYWANTAVLANQHVSKDTFSDLCNKLSDPTWDEMERMLRRDFGFWDAIPLTDKQTSLLKDMFDATFVTHSAKGQQALYNYYNPFAATVFDVMDSHSGIGWTSIKHTGNPVPVFAVGVGSELFSPMSDNTEISARIREACKKYQHTPVMMR